MIFVADLGEILMFLCGFSITSNDINKYKSFKALFLRLWKIHRNQKEIIKTISFIHNIEINLEAFLQE